MKQWMKRVMCFTLTGTLMCGVCGCNTKSNVNPTQSEIPTQTESETGAGASLAIKDNASVYLTTPGDMYKFVRQEDGVVKVYAASELDAASGWIVPVDVNAKKQTIDGWGATLSGSTAVNMSKLTDEQLEEVMNRLFDEDKGIGLNMLRQSLGCCDFSEKYVSYDDVPGDVELEHFSIAYDEEMIIPYIKKAAEVADDLTVVSAVWSAPTWMKTLDEIYSDNKAAIKREYYQVYANYIVKALQAYKDAGVEIEYLSPQNEPTGVHRIPANYYDANAYSTFVNQYLVPTLEANNLAPQLIGWDFNHSDVSWDFISKTYENIDVIGYHTYYLRWDLQCEVAEAFTDKRIWQTEASNRAVSGTNSYMTIMKYITRSLRSYASAYFMFNIMLEDGGPAEDVSFSLPAGLLEYDSETEKVSYRTDYYAFGHFSKFIRPGAVILDTLDIGKDTDDNIQNIVAVNENGAMTIVLTNNTGDEQTFKFVIGEKVLEYTLPAMSGATITWDANVYE